MPRVLSSALLSLAAVPALLTVPVAGPAHGSAHPVAPTVTMTALSGVDATALAEENRPAAAGSTASSGGGSVTASVTPRRPAVLTAKRATKRFDLVGLTWRRAAAPAGTVVRVRVRESGRWAAWQALETDDSAPDPGSAEAHGAASSEVRDGTAPLLTNGADGVQVRVDTPTGQAPAGLTLDLVDAGRSVADGGGSGGPAAAAMAATPRPGIVTRAQWGADERLVKAAPVVNTAVRTLVLHHTATTNSYSASQAYAQVRSVYAFHTRGRGWNDLGYNFLVDRYGRVYEGRRGSLTSPIMGAHAIGFNGASVGISVLGTFSTTPPPGAVINSVVDVLAWQAAQYGVNPRGTLSVLSAGGSGNRFRAGVTARVAGIVGHRDLGFTECPGNALYPRLAAIRSAVAARMVPGLVDPSLDGSPAPAGGAPVTFSASVPTRQTWTMTVRPLCGGTAVRTLSGTASRRIVGTWDLTDDAGRPVPPGPYTVSVSTRSPVGAVAVWQRDVEVLATKETALAPLDQARVAAPVAGVPRRALGTVRAWAFVAPTTAAPACPVQRVAADDPALTSVIAGRLTQPAARSVVLVNATGGESAFADALAVAPLAVARQAPLLLTGASALPDVVARDITARGVTAAWLVGSTAAVSPAVEQQLRALGVTTVTRISGADRWAAAAAVATTVGAPAGRAVLVPGDQGELLDALVAAGSAAGTGTPVLLTSRSGVPAATLAALRELRVTSVTVVGSTVAVPESTLGALASAGVTSHTRLVGAGRWATAVAVATAFEPRRATDRVVLTSGWVTGPELLIASAQGLPVLLSAPEVLPWNTADWLRARPLLKVAVIASPAQVGLPVIRAVQSTRG